MDTAKRSNDLTMPEIQYSISTGPAEERELNLYFVLFSVHKNKEWTAHAGYIFAYDRDSLQSLLDKKYGSVVVRSAASVTIQEGTVLYGERWTQI